MAEQNAHVVQLADRIGPRPATSDEEVQAAEYVASVLADRGLAPETQEFDTPRTDSWAYVLYHLFTLIAAVGSRWLPWPMFVLAVVVAFVMWRDLDTRWGLSALMPKGPSQNVIARHVPKQRRNEETRTVVIVAHVDTAKSSLAFSPALVKNFAVTFGLMKACTALVPVFIFLAALPFAKAYKLIPWYATLAVSAYLVVPLLINVHRELFMHPTLGANDNASGVATMLGIMERLVPEADADVFETSSLPAVSVTRRAEEDAWAADVVPEGSVLAYTPPGPSRRAPFDDHDFDDAWGETEPSAPSRGQTSWELPEDEEAPMWSEPGLAPGPEPGPPPASQAPPAAVPERRGFLGRRKGRDKARNGEVREWLGVDEGFDAKVEGEKIGSWEHFEEEDDDLGWKGGTAGGDGIDDPEFASDEAARIRRRVTTGIDHALTEKEAWFVLTGAEEVGTRGMLALLAEYGEELKDALFINLDNLGTGTLAWVTSEGMAKRYTADRRLTGAARRVASENEWPIKGRAYRGLSTDATPLLARRFKAMSVMAFDINGRLPNWHWKTDTSDEVQPENIEQAVDFVTALIKEL